VNRAAKLERFEQGAQYAAGTFKSTNVQDAIDELAGVTTGAGSGAIADAPFDHTTYGRNQGIWVHVLDVTGGTMTGPLVLAADPATALGASTKQYVDNTTVSLSGDTMTGALVLNADPTAALGAVTKQYADQKVSRNGDTMTGALILNADPSVALGAATKQYVDAHTGAGSTTLTGDVTGTGTGTVTTTLATVNSTVGTYQGITVNAKGLVTSAANQNYAPLASPALSGTPTAPTPVSTDNSTTIATTAFVQSAIGTPGVVPVNAQSVNYTAVLADAGKAIYHPIADNNARTFTIPANASVAYTIGTVISFVNLINTVTIAITTDTMYLAGLGTTGSRTLAAYGCCTALKVDTTTWIISGTGLT
jgi:hypothetical protein